MNRPLIAADAPTWVHRAAYIIHEYEVGEQADAGFDAGEWSGPAHARDLEQELARIALEAGLDSAEEVITKVAEHTIRFVNAYSVERCYGGPEEGGWWYDAGEPIASIPIRGSDDPESAKGALRAMFGWPRERSQGRYSVLGGADFEIYVEDGPPEAFPKQRPHYE